VLVISGSRGVRPEPDGSPPPVKPGRALAAPRGTACLSVRGWLGCPGSASGRNPGGPSPPGSYLHAATPASTSSCRRHVRDAERLRPRPPRDARVPRCAACVSTHRARCSATSSRVTRPSAAPCLRPTAAAGASAGSRIGRPSTRSRATCSTATTRPMLRYCISGAATATSSRSARSTSMTPSSARQSVSASATLRVHPRSDPSRPLTGVFKTRPPDRPNPLGLHPVTVLEIDGARLRVGPIEAIDGTPVVDLKIAPTC